MVTNCLAVAVQLRRRRWLQNLQVEVRGLPDKGLSLSRTGLGGDRSQEVDRIDFRNWQELDEFDFAAC